MSKQSEKARAERRAEHSGFTPEVVPLEALEPVPMVQSVALIADGGGYRLAIISLPADVAERYAIRVSEPEVLSVQIGLAIEALDAAARSGLDEEGKPKRPTCPTCGVDALLRHPNKPVMLCAACDARFEVT
jgi:hypothetical protein